MFRSRVIYTCLFLLSFISFLLDGEYLFLYFLVFLAVLPLIMLCTILPVAAGLSVQVAFPANAVPKGHVLASFLAVNGSVVPCPYVRFYMRYRSLLGDSESRLIPYEDEVEQFTVGARDQVSIQTMLPIRHCGKLEIELVKVRVCDMLGLISLPVRRARKSGVLKYVYVLPTAEELNVELQPNLMTNGDTELYSKTHAGKDMSEIFQVREYQDGDRLRDVHWKLSLRSDRMIVKEYGEPLIPSAHFLLELQDGVEPQAADCLMNVYYSLALELIRQERIFCTSFLQSECGLESATVSSGGELSSLLARLLSMPGQAPWFALEQMLLYPNPLSGGHLIYLVSGMKKSESAIDEMETRLTALIDQNRFRRVTVFMNRYSSDAAKRLSEIGCSAYDLSGSALQREVLIL